MLLIFPLAERGLTALLCVINVVNRQRSNSCQKNLLLVLPPTQINSACPPLWKKKGGNGNSSSPEKTWETGHIKKILGKVCNESHRLSQGMGARMAVLDAPSPVCCFSTGGNKAYFLHGILSKLVSSSFGFRPASPQTE